MLTNAAPHRLRIYLFGQPRFEADGKPHKFAAPPKTLPLLAYLLLHRTGPISREKLAYTLWQDDPEDEALVDLRRHLYYLNRALVSPRDGVPWILADKEIVRWNPSADAWLDIAEFERSIASGSGREAAVELYAGDLLENLYDDWVFAERDRLKSSYLSALGELLVERRGRRDYAMAAAYASRILTVDPWREDVVRQLMMIRFESGDRAGALTAFERFASVLRKEMDVEPMPETIALREMILRGQLVGDPSTRGVDDAEGDGSRAIPALPFAGRAQELEHLKTLWSRAARGRGSAVFVWGEAGIGKTRLVSELALRAEAEGARVVAGGTSDPEAVPYQALVEALRSVTPMVAALDVDPIWLAALSVIMPDLRARRPDLPALPAVEADRERTRLFQSLSATIEALARPRPLLLVLEDLHWARGATIDALEFLERRMSEHPILVVATFREEEAPRGHALREAVRRLRRDKLASSTQLRGLDRTAIEFILSNTEGSVLPGEVLAETAQRLQETTEGHPLFLSEFIRGRKETGAPVVEAPVSNEVLVMPRSIQAMLATRMVRLSPEARALADAIAVIGSGVDVDFLHDVMDWGEDRVLEQLDELRDRRIVRDSTGRNRFDYVFTHHLIQTAFYESLPEEERAAWHRRVARLIERSSVLDERERAAVLARHFDLGGDAQRAVRWYLVAARQALEVQARSEAFELAARGLTINDDAQARRELLLLQETVLGSLGDRSRQRELLGELASTARQADDQEFTFAVLRRRAWFHRVVGERRAEWEALESLLEAAGSVDAVHRAIALLERGTHRELIGEYDAASADISEAALLFAVAGDAEGEAECYCLLSRVAAHRERVVEARAMIDRALAIGDRAGPRVKAKLLETAANEAAVREDFAASEAAARQLLDVCRGAGDRSGEAAAHLSLANAANALLLVGAARMHYEAAGHICSELGDIEGQARTLHDRGVLDISVGNNAAAQQALTRAEELFSTIGHERGAGYCALNLSALAFQTQRYGEGKAAAIRALEAAKKMKNQGLEAGALVNLAINQVRLGESREALVHAEAAVALLRSTEQPAELAALLAELALIRTLAGDARGAVPAADECLSLLEQHRLQVRWPSVILWQVAQVYHAAQHQKRSRDLLNEAYALLRKRAGEMPDDETRVSFESVCYHRELSAAHERGEWPELGARP